MARREANELKPHVDDTAVEAVTEDRSAHPGEARAALPVWLSPVCRNVRSSSPPPTPSADRSRSPHRPHLGRARSRSATPHHPPSVGRRASPPAGPLSVPPSGPTCRLTLPSRLRTAAADHLRLCQAGQRTASAARREDPKAASAESLAVGRVRQTTRRSTRRPGPPENVLRFALLDFITDASWTTRPSPPTWRQPGWQAAHGPSAGDPAHGRRSFAGGGSPLEPSSRADAFASDLNPVAVLLHKVVLEYIPKYDQRLADGSQVGPVGEGAGRRNWPSSTRRTRTGRRRSHTCGRTIRCEGRVRGRGAACGPSGWRRKRTNRWR